MALLRIPPTRLDRAVAQFAAEHATPRIEGPLQLITYVADEHILLAVSFGAWLASRRMSARRRGAANDLLLNVAVSALLPHILKTLIDQERPDRRIHGNRHGIPVSGKAYDAFPSGHAVHIGAVVAVISRHFPRWRPLAWTVGAGVAVTRIALLAHWTSDVLAGLVLGASLERGLRALRLYQSRSSPRKRDPGPRKEE